MKQTVCSIVCCLLIIFSFAACTAQPQVQPTAPPTEQPVKPTDLPPQPTIEIKPTAKLEPTATPVPTATLVPIDLVLTIQDANGNPVPMAKGEIANLPDSGFETDKTGHVEWKDLAAETIPLVVQASGYKKLEKELTLQRGANTESIQLEDDPLGLKAVSACGKDEKLVYIEDLQDKKADNWPEIDAEAMGWSVMEKPDESGNFVVAASGNKDLQPPGTNLRTDLVFDNAVWRVKVWFEGSQAISTFLNWRHSFENGDQRYFPHIGPQVLIDMTRFNSGDGITVGRSGTKAPLKKWVNFEVSYYSGEVQVWMNGKKLVIYTDKNPLPPGTIGLEPHFNGAGIIYYDNLAVCELNAPFVSLPLPTPVKK
jgi:hypothetical protein